MPNGPCPRCTDQPLARGVGALTEDVCPKCSGRFLPEDAARRVILDELGISQEVLRDLVGQFGGRRVGCPGCTFGMRPVRLRGLWVDLCLGCGGAWLDAGELSKLSEGRWEEVAAAPPSVAPAATTTATPTPAQRARAESPASEGARAAIFLARSEPPPVDVLIGCFQKCPRLTEGDARMAALAGVGVLLADIALDDARVVHAALLAQGVACDVVDPSWLAVPPPVRVSLMSADAEGITVVDGNAAPARLPWSQVRALLSGQLRSTGLQRGAPSVLERVDGRAPTASFDDAPVAGSLEIKESEDWVCDVTVDHPSRRYRATASTLRRDGYVVGRPQAFAALVEELRARASAHVALGRGIENARDGQRGQPRFKSPRHLDRAQAWLLWRAHGPGARFGDPLR